MSLCLIILLPLFFTLFLSFIVLSYQYYFLFNQRLLRERDDNVFLRSSSAIITTKTLLKMLSKRYVRVITSLCMRATKSQTHNFKNFIQNNQWKIIWYIKCKYFHFITQLSKIIFYYFLLSFLFFSFLYIVFNSLSSSFFIFWIFISIFFLS